MPAEHTKLIVSTCVEIDAVINRQLHSLGSSSPTHLPSYKGGFALVLPIGIQKAAGKSPAAFVFFIIFALFRFRFDYPATFSAKRMNSVAASARVAVPAGTMALSVRPLISPTPTAHCTASMAQSLMSDASS